MAEGIKRRLKDLLFDLQHLLPSSFLVLTWGQSGCVEYDLELSEPG